MMNSPENSARGKRQLFAVFLMVIAALSFAISAECVHGLERRDLPWSISFFFRAAIGLPIILILALPSLRTFKLIHKGMLLRTVSGTLFLIILYICLTKMKPNSALAIANTRPIWVAILAWFFFRVHLRWSFWISSIMAIIGATVLGGGMEMNEPFEYVLLALLAAALGGVGYFAIDMCRNLRPAIVALHLNLGLIVGAIAILLIFKPSVDFAAMKSTPFILLILGVGFFGALYQVFLTWSIQILGSVSGSVAGLLTVACTYGMDFYFWSTQFDWQHLIGLLLILVPAIYIAFGGRFVRDKPVSA